jgi:serine/threonine protein phosphatase 1
MKLTYVIPDIHGRFDLLGDGLAKNITHSAAGTIITLGDYVSKGPESKQVIDLLRRGVADDWRFIPLKGNHDAMMVEALRNPDKMDDWIKRGGEALASYGGDAAIVPQAHIDWLDGLRLMHADDHRVYVHAGVDHAIPLHQQTESTLLSKRYPKGYPGGIGDRHVVHGHDSAPEGPLLYEGRTNLDTHAWRTGRLVIGIFEDEKAGGPLDFIEIQGPPS